MAYNKKSKIVHSPLFITEIYIKVCLISILVITLFTIICCSKGKSVNVNQALNDQTVIMNRNTALFQTIIREQSSKKRERERTYEQYRSRFSANEFDSYDFNLLEDDRRTIDIIKDGTMLTSSVLSYDTFAILYKTSGETRQGREFVNEESIYIRLINSDYTKKIFSHIVDEKPIDLKHFPTMTWDPYSHLYAFVGRERNSDNIYLGYFEYTDQGIKYINFKITDNQDRDISYFDVTWSPYGDYIAYSQYNKRDNKYSVNIYSLDTLNLIQHQLGENVANFRFSPRIKDACFFAKYINGAYHPMFSNNFRRTSGSVIKEAEPLHSPVFIANFAWRNDRLAYVAIDDNKFTLNIYSYENRNSYLFKSPSIDYCQNNTVPTTNYGPIWLLDDNFLIVNDIVQRSSIFQTYVNHSYLISVQKSSSYEFRMNNFISDRDLWYISSVSTSTIGNRIIFIGYDNSSVRRDYCFYDITLDINRVIKSNRDELKTYNATISFFSTAEGENLYRLTRPRREFRGTVATVGYITSERIMYYYNDIISEQELNKGGKFYIEWPASIEERDIFIRLEPGFRETRTQRPVD